MPKARKRPFLLSEGRVADDNHVRLTGYMLMHPKFLNLNPGAKVLYIYMRDWAKGKEKVTYTASLAEKVMARTSYFRARDELCEAGFIFWTNKPQSSNQRNEASVFEFSDRWHTGKPHRSEAD